jgi:hypothetical protein
VNQAASLHQLLASARKRCVSHLALDALLLALAVGFGTAAIVLIAGTEFLGFYWIAIGLLIGLGIGFWLLRKRTPAEYAVAQQMDQRLSLQDTLSTAAYFSSPAAPAQTDPTIRDAQLTRAAEIAQTVDIKAALPMGRPSSLYPATVLALIAIGVFLFRFAVTGSFDPRASLIKNALNALVSPSGEKTKVPGQQGKGDKQGDGETDKQDTADKDKNDFAGDPASEPNPNSPDQQNQAKNDADKDDQNQDKQDGQNSDSQSPQGKPVAQDDQKNQGNPQNGNQGNQQNQDESMFDKMKQAISDLMNKMKPQSGEGKGKSNQKSESSQAKAEESKDDNQSDNSQDSNENQNGADTQETANNAANQSSKEQQNGAGNNEGDKSQKQAEALKAMGKLSELMGKRAENITGAVMVEVGSTKQQMKTPISQSAAKHSEAGSEIHRDEVPPMYQQFVQQYFDQVRKTAPAANKAAAASAPASQP